VSLFRDRSHAGQLLARALSHYRDQPGVVVLGIPPGGMPVAFEIASCLRLPLDAFVVRPLELPEHRGPALGALASGGTRVIEAHRIARLHLSKASIESASRHEWNEIVRLEQSYRGDRRPHPIRDMTAILVDDGMTAGAALRAAVLALRKQQPKRVAAAVPSLSSATCDELAPLVEEIVCAATPVPFLWEGSRYAEVPTVTEEHVRELIAEAHRETAAVTSRRAAL
jgi:predicted phosphoribosyltransferase